MRFFSKDTAIKLTGTYAAYGLLCIILRMQDLVSIKMCALCLALSLAGTLLFFLFTHLNRRVPSLLLFITVCVHNAYFLSVAVINRGDILAVTPFCAEWAAGLFIWGMIWLFVLSLSGRRFRKAGLIILHSLMCAGALANYFVFQFRGTSLTFSDFGRIGTALNVLGSYQARSANLLLVALALCLFALMTGQMLWMVSLLQDMPVRVRIPAAVASALFVLLIFFTRFLALFGVEHPGYYRNSMGLLLNLILQAQEQCAASAPAGYDPADVDAVYAQYASDDPQSASTPNIIVIMNESFADLSVLGSLPTEEDVLPCFHTLSEHSIGGWAYSSVFGGNTAESEYEFLSGDATLINQNAYALISGKRVGSMASALSAVTGPADGTYACYALHPYYANGYHRSTAYEALGFDRFFAMDDFPDLTSYRSQPYVNDASQYRLLFDLITLTDDPVFCFDVTMQNHGGYADITMSPLYDDYVHITDAQTDYPEVRNYLSLVRESDRALYELLETLKTCDEPVVVCMFGDHQPGLPDGFYQAMTGRDRTDLLYAEDMPLYKVPFLIWANFDLADTPRFVDRISLNYLGTYLCNVLDLPMTGYQKYLLDLYERYPVVTAHGVLDQEGSFYTTDALPQEIETYLYVMYSHWRDPATEGHPFFFLGQN